VFFNEQTDSSRIKAFIVSEYFPVWANIVGQGKDKIAYIDLYSGPGKYSDGTDSTPLLILNKVVVNPKLREQLISLFQDSSEDYIKTLDEEVKKIPGYEALKFKPKIGVAKTDQKLIEELNKVNKVPSLFFIDPFGYSGLSIALIKEAIRDWGCDCIFFFNYNRINTHLSNPVMKKNMDSFFGENTADKLRDALQGTRGQQRETTIIRHFKSAIHGIGGNYSIGFKFYQVDSKKTSHYLVLATKHERGYEVMKEIMAKVSEKIGGVPTYIFRPTTRPKQADLFHDSDHRILDLAKLLTDEFSGKQMKVLDIYRSHNIGKPYILDNYKQALLRLEQQGKISVDRPAEKRMRLGKITMGDDRLVTFE
jgi:three-Cys-motif partner protein